MFRLINFKIQGRFGILKKILGIISIKNITSVLTIKTSKLSVIVKG